jgi:flagellar biosynthesis/type III secretory pathway protein FliH
LGRGLAEGKEEGKDEGEEKGKYLVYGPLAHKDEIEERG